MEKSRSWEVIQRVQENVLYEQCRYLDHHDLFIYIDSSYPDSFHDVSFLRESKLYGTWRKHFAHYDGDQYFEYVLGDAGYVGTEMFIMQRIQGHEVGNGISQEVVDAWNKMHPGYHI